MELRPSETAASSVPPSSLVFSVLDLDKGWGEGNLFSSLASPLYLLSGTFPCLNMWWFWTTFWSRRYTLQLKVPIFTWWSWYGGNSNWICCPFSGWELNHSQLSGGSCWDSVAQWKEGRLESMALSFSVAFLIHQINDFGQILTWAAFSFSLKQGLIIPPKSHLL